jgi:hypothetical protein
MFERFNLKHWGGSLPLIEIQGTRIMEDYGEYLCPMKSSEDSPEKYCIRININQSLIEQERTLLHEMCHHSVFLKYKEKYFKKKWSWHGREWKKEMTRVGFGERITKYT